MASFNRVVLVGNLTRAIELRHLQGGTAVCDVGLAVNEKHKNAAGEWVEEAVFVDCTLWGKTAEIAAQYLDKGSCVLIEGRLKLDSWETKEGEKRSKLKVVGEKLQFLDRKGDRDSEARTERPSRGRSERAERPEREPATMGDDIPF